MNSVFKLSVFELIDYSDDEVYHTLGMFRSLDEAVAEVHVYCNESGDPPRSEHSRHDDDDLVVLVIKERPFGFDEGRDVWRRSWRKEWDDNDQSRWVLVEAKEGSDYLG